MAIHKQTNNAKNMHSFASTQQDYTQMTT